MAKNHAIGVRAISPIWAQLLASGYGRYRQSARAGPVIHSVTATYAKRTLLVRSSELVPFFFADRDISIY